MHLKPVTTALLFALGMGILTGCGSSGSDDKDTTSGKILSDWSTYQGNAEHNGYIPFTFNPENFKLKWSVQLGETGQLKPIATADKTVFAVNSFLYAIDIETGETKWNEDFSSLYSISPPATGNGKVYLASSGREDTFLWALDQKTKALEFKKSFNSQWDDYYAPTVFADDIYYNGGNSGGVYASDNQDGLQLWFAQLHQYDQWTPAINEQYVISYLGSNTGSYPGLLTATNRIGGSTEFVIEDPDFDWSDWSMNLAPVLFKNQVFAINNGRLLSFDLQNRNITWQKDNQYSGQPVVANNTIYTISNGSVEALNVLDGSRQWSWIAGTSSEDHISGTMIISNNLLFCSTENATYALDISTQEVVWQTTEVGQLAIGGYGNLYIANPDGKLTSYSLTQ
ncbi:outer membrane protein assembly factor BamB family protein [Pelagibaculum spongiae]|uniref:Pyrrolo-quinoline quinone repeat domain-containing protein n=1 Tax=Pelagibaculum spongiae TaxID=2080658 RepID=A0A2V1GQ25_9GAMM|nr:PQQ-binding-like beta-propeller repeat protein [Pelagibaculum spongiae]PVZ65619.1 hypothetical protein DC094_17180 [Pelagibaculum spongiae]